MSDAPPRYRDYSTLRVAIDGRIATITLDHPPLNLLDRAMLRDLDRLSRELADDPSLSVAIFASADPEFFIAHADLELLSALPSGGPPARELGPFYTTLERLRRLPLVTIAQIEGRARGGGNEVVLALDLRFGALGRCRFGQPEIAVGLVPGGGATQQLPRLIGRARALEAILGGGDFDAELAERYGWINRALPADQLDTFVRDLAERIAAYSPAAVRLAKAAVDAGLPPLEPGLLAEARAFTEVLSVPDTRARMRAFLQAGGQTRAGERELDALSARAGGDEPVDGGW